MDIQTAKLVAFALWAETLEGVMAKGPGPMRVTYDKIMAQDGMPDIAEIVGPFAAARFQNYCKVWDVTVDAPQSEKGEENVRDKNN